MPLKTNLVLSIMFQLIKLSKNCLKIPWKKSIVAKHFCSENKAVMKKFVKIRIVTRIFVLKIFEVEVVTNSNEMLLTIEKITS